MPKYFEIVVLDGFRALNCDGKGSYRIREWSCWLSVMGVVIEWLNNHNHSTVLEFASILWVSPLRYPLSTTQYQWKVHYPLWPTLWFIGLLPTITMKPSGIFLCAQHSPGPRRSWASYAVTPPAFNIHWIPDVPEQAVGLSPPRTFTEFWHVFVRSVWWNTSKSLRWLRHHRVPCGPGSSLLGNSQ